MFSIDRNNTTRVHERLPGSGERDAVFALVKAILVFIPFKADDYLGIFPYKLAHLKTYNYTYIRLPCQELLLVR